MLYEIAHFLRSHCAFLWEWIEEANALAFALRYRGGLAQVGHILAEESRNGLSIQVGLKEDAKALAEFFARQPESDFEFFRPHAFDEGTLRKLLKRKSFLIYLVKKEGEIVGYFFLRSFVHGQCYLGKMVDHERQGQGIGKLMCLTAMKIARTIGLRMFESISKRNMASMRSSAAVLRQVIVEELEGDDLLIEDLPYDKVDI